MLTICHNYFCITPSNKNGKDAIQPTSKRKFVLGIFILLLVDVLWVVSSELTKYIYVEKKLEKPFLISYVRSSLLFIYLIVLCFTPPTKDPCRPSDYTQLLEPTTETDDENFYNEASNSLGDSTFVPVRAGETTDSDDATPRAVRFNKVAEVRVMSAAMAGEALLARLSWAASMRASEYAQRRAAAAATRRHLRLAFFVFMPWFVSNYLYRVSLSNSATSTALVFASSAGALALATSALLAQAPTDRLTLPKGVAVLLTTASLVILGISEGHQSNWIAVLSALGAGFCYAIHLLIFRHELRKGDGINCPLLVGLVGCVCGGAAWVLGGVLAAAGVERPELPPASLCSWVLLDAAIGPLLIESLWLWGCSLTSPWTATCVASLVLPAAACADAWRGAGPAGAVASALAAAGWSAAALPAPARLRPLHWIRDRLRASDRFTTLRNIPDLDEQSEALMCSEEPS